MQPMICFIFLVIFLSGELVFQVIRRNRLQKRINDIEIQREKERDELETMLRETLGNITHDLKTPLTAIRGYSQGILDGVAGTPDRMNKYVSTIRNKADDMAELVDELSLFARIFQKDVQYQRSEVDVNQYISSCMSHLSLDLETKKIDFLYRNDVRKGTRICIDTEKVKRVFYNIIGNASKFMTEQAGLIYVLVEEQDGAVWIHIEDNGAGIDRSELPYIFDRFYRADSSRSSKTGGSGLGLAIAKKIIEDHNGQIFVASEKGKGTKISFSLPKGRSGNIEIEKEGQHNDKEDWNEKNTDC